MEGIIEKYSFGLIKINGREYNYDVEVRSSGEVLRWQRKESHLFDIASEQRAVEQNPDIIIFGTGESGMARLSPEAEKLLKEKGIGFVVDKTGEAIKTFNIVFRESRREGKKEKVIGLFHLTC